MKEILRLNDYPDKFVRNVCRAIENNDSKEGVSGQQGDVRWVSVPYVKGMSEAIANILRPLSIIIYKLRWHIAWYHGSGAYVVSSRIAWRRQQRKGLCTACLAQMVTQCI